MRSNTDWFRDAKWGIIMHYLTQEVGGDETMSTEEWNRLVDNFDVDALATQLKEVGAGYMMITVGQNSGHYCSPNETYDRLVGIKPSKCSRRDLVNDLYGALNPLGIKLIAYLPNGAPMKDPVAVKKLKWVFGTQYRWLKPLSGLDENGKPWGLANPRLAEFQRYWEAIITEWSLRWGNKVSGCWIDGCYFPEAMYEQPEAPNYESFVAALKAGNSDSIVAFNPGTIYPIISITQYEDYTAGELIGNFPTCPGRWVDGKQFHVMSPLTGTWDERNIPQLPNEFIAAYTHYVNSKEGVVTWDAPPNKDGTIQQQFLNQLRALETIA